MNKTLFYSYFKSIVIFTDNTIILSCDITKFVIYVLLKVKCVTFESSEEETVTSSGWPTFSLVEIYLKMS